MSSFLQTNPSIFAARFVLCCLLFFGFSSLNVNAQSISVTPTKVTTALDEPFQIEYRADNLRNVQFQTPAFRDFTVVGGPSQMQNNQYVNGKFSGYTAITYALQAKKVGSFTIPPAIISSGSKKYKTKAVSVTVTKGKVAPQANGSNATASGTQYPDIFLQIDVDTTDIYMGQQITVQYNLYSAFDITNYQVDDAPSFPGFWVQDLTPKRLAQPQKRVMGNKRYSIYSLKTFALFPQKSGEMELEPMKTTIQYRQSTNNSRSIFQSYRSKSKKVNAATRKINVYQLPEQGKPANFGGGVGQMSCTVRTDKRNCEVNDAISLTVQIQGTGNLMLLEPPVPQFPESFDMYEPETSENIYHQNGIITGKRTVEYVFVPTEEGNFKIPPINFSYFDIAKQQYQEISGRATNIRVAPDSGKTAVTKPKVKKEDLLPNITSTTLKSIDNSDWWLPIAGLLYVLPLFMFPVFAARQKRQNTAAKDVVGNKRRAALSLAKKRLETAKTHQEANARKPFYNEVIQCIWGYLGDKLNLPVSSLDKQNIEATLLTKNVDTATTSKLINTIEYCEMALYAPMPDADNLEATYSTTLQLIADIEEKLEA